MQTADEITSNLKNLRYYTDRISELTRKQFDLDVKLAEQVGINSEPGAARFDSLGIIRSDCEWIRTYCDNIEVHLKQAEAQDKILSASEENKETSHA